MSNFEDDVNNLVESSKQENESWLDPSTDDIELNPIVLSNIKKLYQHNLPRLLHVLYTEYDHPRKPELIAYFTDTYRLLIDRNHGEFGNNVVKKLLSASTTHPRLYITWYTLFFDRWLTEAFIEHHTRKYGNGYELVSTALFRYAEESPNKHRDDIIASKTLYNAMLG